MSFTLMSFPYEFDALEPYMSRETVEYHYGRHHLAYVTALNNLIKGTKYEDMGLEDIITESAGVDQSIFNNAAQDWNHNFFWESLRRTDGQIPDGRIGEMIAESFGSYEDFRETFKQTALGRFGSGWVWLVQEKSGLELYSSANGENPLTLGGTPLLGCDVWEHAYYIDTRNERGEYIDNFFNIIDWDVVNSRLV